MTQLPTTSSESTPAFGCVVYVRRLESGQTAARVANLDGIEVTASAEPAALGQIVAAVKQRLQTHRAAGEDIPWVDPPVPKRDDEQKRFLPLHL